jgi:hypothetical protein
MGVAPALSSSHKLQKNYGPSAFDRVSRDGLNEPEVVWETL